MKTIHYVSICALLAQSVLCAADEEIKKATQSADKGHELAEQCAAYIARKQLPKRSRRIIDHDEDRRQNPLHVDPEQQDEREASFLDDVLRHMQQIKEDVETKDEAHLRQYERACRVIIQALLQEAARGKPDALQYAQNCLQLVAYIKLQQDPFWAVKLREVGLLHAVAAPTYRPDQLDAHLGLERPTVDPAIDDLLAKIDSERSIKVEITDEGLADLEVSPFDKEIYAERLLAVLNAIDMGDATKMYQPPISKEAKDFYNQAAVNEVKAMVQFEHVHHKREYLDLETAFRAVALTYLKAHDAGHPSGLKDAEKLMASETMDAIIRWKQRKGFERATESFAAIWAEIGMRKRKDR